MEKESKRLEYVSPQIDINVYRKDVILLSAGTNDGADGNQLDGDWWD